MQLIDFIIFKLKNHNISRELRDYNLIFELRRIFSIYGTFYFSTTRLLEVHVESDDTLSLLFRDVISHTHNYDSRPLRIHNYEVTEETTTYDINTELSKCLYHSGILTQLNRIPYLSHDDIYVLETLEELIS